MKKTIKYALFSVLVLFVTTLLVEIILGIIFHYKDRDLEPMAVHDYPYLYFMFDSSAGLNRHGFKTKYPIRKQPGKYRIILIGGSVARGKLPEESIAHYLEKELNSRFNTDRIEVINAGVSAFVVEQEFILTQLILQHYEPNMIVSLDGYNDLLTFKLNRQCYADFELPPHNWQDFRVIADNREKKETASRFPLFFRNITRAINYMERQQFEKDFDWKMPDEKLQPVSDRYWQVVDDMHDFCKAKNIAYYNFLQPVRFYDSGDTTDELHTLSKLYGLMENRVREKHFAFTLTPVFRTQPAVFTDDCHVTAEGNQMIAKAMAERIAGEVEVWMEY